MTLRVALLWGVVAATLVASGQSTTFATQCFLPTYHRGISNAEPLVELWNVSPDECLTHCVVNAGKTGRGCASVVYHRHFSTCQLYGHDGTFREARVVFANGHDYYNRTNFDGICTDRHPPAKGYLQSRRQFRQFGVVQQIASPGKGSLKAGAEVKQTRRPSPPVSTKSTYLFSNEPASVCNRVQKMGYFVLKDYAVTPTTPLAEIHGVDRFACLNYCAQNINTDGDFAACALISYDAQTEHCQLHDESAKEAAYFTHVQIQQFSVIAEKFCFEKGARCPNDIHLRVLMDKEVDSTPLHIFPRFDTLTECTAACMEHPMCKSVSFRGSTCRLFRANLSLTPDLLITLEGTGSVVVDVKC